MILACVVAGCQAVPSRETAQADHPLFPLPPSAAAVALEQPSAPVLQQVAAQQPMTAEAGEFQPAMSPASRLITDASNADSMMPDAVPSPSWPNRGDLPPAGSADEALPGTDSTSPPAPVPVAPWTTQPSAIQAAPAPVVQAKLLPSAPSSTPVASVPVPASFTSQAAAASRISALAPPVAMPVSHAIAPAAPQAAYPQSASVPLSPAKSAVLPPRPVFQTIQARSPVPYSSLPSAGYRTAPIVWRTWNGSSYAPQIVAPPVSQPPVMHPITAAAPTPTATQWQAPIAMVNYSTRITYAQAVIGVLGFQQNAPVRMGAVTIDYSTLQD